MPPRPLVAIGMDSVLTARYAMRTLRPAAVAAIGAISVLIAAMRLKRLCRWGVHFHTHRGMSHCGSRVRLAKPAMGQDPYLFHSRLQRQGQPPLAAVAMPRHGLQRSAVRP